MSDPANTRQTTRGRVYEDPRTGETAWSVTTIIDAGVPKKALMYWAANEVAEAAVANHRIVTAMVDAVRILRSDDKRLKGIVSDPDAVEGAIKWLKDAPWRKKERRANIGTAVHAWIEAHTLGRPIDPEQDPAIAPYVPGWLDFLERYRPEFLATEMSVWNLTESYAGTLDWIARIQTLAGPRIVIGDAKSGKDVYADVALQLNAYARAEYAVLRDGTRAPLPGPIDGAVVLHLRDDGTARLVPVELSERVFKAFLYAREVMRWAEDISKDGVLGAPLLGPDGMAMLWPSSATPEVVPAAPPAPARRQRKRAA